MSATIRERPILLSAPMVRAVRRDREPKTQTRRVIPCATGDEFDRVQDAYRDGRVRAVFFDHMGEPYGKPCPFGAPGNQLWVREGWGYTAAWPPDLAKQNRATPWYRADGHTQGATWYPSIHMPRWASRLTLALTDIRVERAQAITEADAQAEGIVGLSKDDGRTTKWGLPARDGWPAAAGEAGWPWDRWQPTARDAFRVLWDDLNAARGYGWDVNPWVFALTFRRVEAPTDG